MISSHIYICVYAKQRNRAGPHLCQLRSLKRCVRQCEVCPFIADTDIPTAKSILISLLCYLYIDIQLCTRRVCAVHCHLPPSPCGVVRLRLLEVWQATKVPSCCYSGHLDPIHLNVQALQIFSCCHCFPRIRTRTTGISR